jgi:proline iminopeptidase
MAHAPQGVTGYEHEDAWDNGWLRVDDTHEVYYEQYGKRDGKPGTFSLSIWLAFLMTYKGFQ